MKFTTEDRAVLIAISGDPAFTSARLFEQKAHGHKFNVGQKVRMIGLQQFPEFNGDVVEITGIREDGSNGLAYYFDGPANTYMNWIYEYRLEAI